MRGAIVVVMVVLSGCVMDTRDPAEPECVDGFTSCGEGSAGPWCIDGRTLTGGGPSCDTGVVTCVDGEPTCDPDDFDL